MNSTITEIQTSVSCGAGLITLNRAKALNALSLPMVQALLATLRAWGDDPAAWGFAKAQPWHPLWAILEALPASRQHAKVVSFALSRSTPRWPCRRPVSACFRM